LYIVLSLSYIAKYEYKPKSILQKPKTGTGSNGSGSRFVLHRYIKMKGVQATISPLAEGQKGGMSTKYNRERIYSYEAVDHVQ